MTESWFYDEENFDLSYSSRQKEMQRIIIRLRASLGWSIEEMAQATGMAPEKLNAIELGEQKITLLDFGKIIESSGFLGKA